MWLSLNWIKDYVDYEIDRSADELGVLVSLRVAEVEEVKIAGESLAQVRVIEVIETEKHPEADKLKVVTITDGEMTRKIVCGASNCRVGIKVPFADLGACFKVKDKDGKESDFVIKPIKIRGVESTGMLCSESELGMAENSDGILELPADTPLGAYLNKLPAYAGADDTLFEVDNKSLTHRPDLWGHYGFAREFSAIFDLPLKPYPGLDIATGAANYAINNKNADACRRYSALEISGITVTESPEWLKQRLVSCGINAINNIVDITNYLLLELGQPMHAFDTAKLSEKAINIRMASEGEKFVALDEEEYTLAETDIVIDNAGKAVALAGIMGGLDSGISEATTSILLESANFDAATVRRTSTRTGLRSDSSARFEKSLDPENTTLALKRAAQLILELCPQAKVEGTIVDSYDNPYEKLSISTTTSFIQKRLGSENITEDFIRTKLTALGFGLEGDLNIAIPTWRATKDVSIAEDIIEEVGRMFGYDNITPSHLDMELKPAVVNKVRLLERRVKTALVDGLGFTEVLTYPWTGEKQLAEYKVDGSNLMTLKNSMSEDAIKMRSESMPHLIDAIAENVKYRDGFRFFEFGRVYDTTKMKGLLPTEKFKLVGALVPAYAKKDNQTEAFYETKALVLDLLKTAGINGPQIKPLTADKSWIHPGISCGIYRGKQKLAEIYKLHPALAASKGIRHNAYLFCIHFDEIEKSERKFKYKAVCKFPEVPFDVTVLADRKELAGNIQQVIKKAAKKLLRGIEVFSVYEDENLGEDKKTVSFRMQFGADTHTLKPEEITKVQKDIMTSLEKAGYSIH